MYLAAVSNPFSEETSFDDFLTKQTGGKNKKQAKPVTMDAKRVDMQVMMANKLLSNFKPKEKGGAK